MDLCSCYVVVDPFLASCLKQDCPTCPARIAVYDEMLVCPLARPLLLSGQPALFACTFYLYLGVTLGHWVPGTETSLSLLFLYNVQHGHIWCLKLLVVLYLMPVANSTDAPAGDLWLSVHVVEM